MVVGANSTMESHLERREPMVAPHKNADAYRNDTTGTLTQSYWEYIRFHSDGTLMIGCSELTGRYWDGGALVGTKPELGQEIRSSTKKVITSNSGTADGFFIENSNKILLCEDNGAVSVWSCTGGVWQMWVGEVSVAEHDDAIMAADYLVPNKEFVTVGAEGDVKVWDISEMVSIRNYKGAHSMAINDVAVQPKSFSTFATVSSDQYVSLWNEDTSKPINAPDIPFELPIMPDISSSVIMVHATAPKYRELKNNVNRDKISHVLKNNCELRCVKFLDENKLVFGDEAGVLRLLDIRNPEAALNSIEFPAPVHRLTIHPESKNIAVSCDNKIVTVCDVSEDDKFKVIYKNRDKHTNYVRGCAWDVADKNILFSVGYDGEMNMHNIADIER